MNDHVAVLRELREDFSELMHGGELVAALDHAIAACEREAELTDFVNRLNTEASKHFLQAMKNGQATVAAVAERDALADSYRNLLARLGELTEFLIIKSHHLSVEDEHVLMVLLDNLDDADDLARVLTEGEPK